MLRTDDVTEKTGEVTEKTVDQNQKYKMSLNFCTPKILLYGNHIKALSV